MQKLDKVFILDKTATCVYKIYTIFHVEIQNRCISTNFMDLRTLTNLLQLAANRDYAKINTSTGFPDIRWHQTADIGYVPNYILNKVFMAVAMDLPDFSSPYGR